MSSFMDEELRVFVWSLVRIATLCRNQPGAMANAFYREVEERDRKRDALRSTSAQTGERDE